jgi:hypothetical protein
MAFSRVSKSFFALAFALTILANSRPADASLYLENATVHDEADAAKLSIIELLDYRTFAVKAVDELNLQAEAGTPLRADQLERFHQNIVARTELKDKLLNQIRPYLELVNHPENVRTDEELFHYLQVMAIGYSLTDNYQDFVETLQNNSHLRHIANEENSSFGESRNSLRETVKLFYSVRFHRPTLRGARRFDELRIDLNQRVLADPDLAFFWTVIESSATFQYLSKQTHFGRIRYDVGFFFKKLFGSKRIFRDVIHNTLADTVFALSKAFGNTAGLFQFRRGYLYHSKPLIQDLQSKLRPGDVLLEKTPFRLTDRFIPGYWGHNAIWLGTEDELKSLGIWDHPKIKPLQARIHVGQSIVEALRPGVTTNTLEHFTDIDCLAILRRTNFTPDQMKEAIIRAAAQYGKKYDFGFDVETQDTLVCSELMFMAYTDVPFKLEKILGRYTINPDSVADAALNGTFDIIMLISDGHFAFGDLRDAMRELISPKK